MRSFRPVSEADRLRYREILQYAFAPERGPTLEESDGPWPPELFDPCGLYDNGQLRSTCKLYDLEAQIRDGYERIGGLGAVATPPQDRNQGYVRELCRHALDTFADRDARLVALWPFDIAFYGQFGWATANYQTRYECPPAALPEHDAAGRMRRVDASEYERLRTVEHAAGVALSIRRSQEWWRERTLTNWDGSQPPYAYGYEREGNLAGYLVYTIVDDPNQTMTVDALAAVDEDAYRAILSFLGTHGAQIEQVIFSRPEESELFERAANPDAIDAAVEPGPMIRLPSVDALDGLSLPAESFSCVAAVSDPLEASPAVVEMSVTDGTVTVESSAREADDADLALDIGTLSQLVVGAQSVTAARRRDTLTLRDDSLTDQLSTAFSEQPVSLSEFF